MNAFKKYFLIAAFSLVAGLTGCESKLDRERKPAVAEPMIENSIQAHQNMPRNSIEADYYAERLRSVLKDVPTEDLETIKNSGITICLDQRLSQQTLGTWDRRIDGIYYIQDKIVSLYDNGKSPGASGFFEIDASTYGSTMLSKLAEEIRNNEVPSQEKFMFAARYSHRSGKTTYRRTAWRSPREFDQESIAKNPQLLTPPVKITKAPVTPATPAL